MPSYQRIKDGRQTNADDQLRGVWYSAGCGYWTDDWDKVASKPGIPKCPTCGCPGMQTEYSQWIAGARRFEKEDHPGYMRFLQDRKENCGGRGFSFIEA